MVPVLALMHSPVSVVYWLPSNKLAPRSGPPVNLCTCFSSLLCRLHHTPYAPQLAPPWDPNRTALRIKSCIVLALELRMLPRTIWCCVCFRALSGAAYASAHCLVHFHMG